MGTDKKAIVGSQDQLLDLLYQGRTLLDSHLLNEALVVFEQARELAPTNPNILSQLARTHAQLKQNREALELYGELMNSSRVTVPVRIEYVKLLLEEGRADEARDLLEEALVDAPDNVTLRSNLGLAYSQLGLYEKARQHFLDARLVHMAEKMEGLLLEKATQEVEVVGTVSEDEPEPDYTDEPETREIDLSELPGGLDPTVLEDDKEDIQDEDSVVEVEEETEKEVIEENNDIPSLSHNDTDARSTDDLMSELFSSDDNLLLTPVDTQPKPSAQASFPFEMAQTAEIDREKLQELLENKATYSEDEMEAQSGEVPQVIVIDAPDATYEELSVIGSNEEDGETISVPLLLPGQEPEAEFGDEEEDFPFETVDNTIVRETLRVPRDLKTLLQESQHRFPEMQAGEIRLLNNDDLLLHIEGHGFCRLGSLSLQIGELETAVAKKRFQGRDLNAVLGPARDPLLKVEGNATLRLRAVEGESRFPIYLTEEDALYLCSGHVAAFSNTLDWENGRFPSPLGTETDLFLDEFWGDGTLILQVEGQLEIIPVEEDSTVRVLHHALVGWFGDLVPNILTSGSGEDQQVFVDFAGIGGVLLKG